MRGRQVGLRGRLWIGAVAGLAAGVALAPYRAMAAPDLLGWLAWQVCTVALIVSYARALRRRRKARRGADGVTLDAEALARLAAVEQRVAVHDAKFSDYSVADAVLAKAAESPAAVAAAAAERRAARERLSIVRDESA